MSFDLNITVNGSRCKQYHHNGKTFIEAKEGSEYVIEIKNNYWKRILAVASVDGLNVLTGKTASETDTGYIVGSYSAEKIKGFRFSDDEWALFKFGYKFNGNTYAQSKQDGSDKNCGVIGLRLFYENEPLWTTYTTVTTTPTYWGTGPQYLSGTCNTGGLNNVTYTSNTSVNYVAPVEDDTLDFFPAEYSRTLSSDTPKRSFSSKISAQNLSATKGGLCSGNESYACAAAPQPQKYDFDMGTEWGRKEASKVRNVTFERGCLAQSFEIYYASRDALIQMGVPVTNTLSVNLPQSFPNNYATPPKNWVG